jgi:ribonuclease T1
MQRNNLLSAAKVLLIVVIGLVLAKNYFTKTATQPNIVPNTPTVIDSNIQTAPSAQNNDDANNANGIPKKVYEVLAYIRANHHAMEGYVGGRIFTNYENVVPQQDDNGNRITYQEWDVNPKIQGVNRGTERILTGSDGRAWYTDDHYRTFKEIR